MLVIALSLLVGCESPFGNNKHNYPEMWPESYPVAFSLSNYSEDGFDWEDTVEVINMYNLEKTTLVFSEAQSMNFMVTLSIGLDEPVMLGIWDKDVQDWVLLEHLYGFDSYEINYESGDYSWTVPITFVYSEYGNSTIYVTVNEPILQ